MTQLEDKLRKKQIGCDNLEGKVIHKAIRERGFYYLLFSDQTWCHTDYQLSVSQILDGLEDGDPIDDPFIEFGLATFEEIDQHWVEYRKEWEEKDKNRRRMEYESLKSEFGE